MNFEQPNEIQVSVEEEESGLKEKKEILSSALKTLLTEDKDLASLPRYALLRPIHTLMEGGISSWKEKQNQALDIIIDFCKAINIPNPKTLSGRQALLDQLDSSELDQKILEISGK